MGLNNRVFLRRGDTFPGLLRPPTNLNPASPGWLKIGAYGAGAAPIISGYKILNTASGWVQHDADTWKVDYSAANSGVTYSGYDSAQGDGDVGFLKVDGVIHGVKRSTLAGLADQWDFYSTGTTLYVRSSAKPTALAADVRCTIDGDGTRMRSGVQLADVAIIGHGACGVRATGEGGSTRCRLLRCHVAEIGGCYLDGYGDGTTRYGNGVQVWTNSANVYCERNTVHDCYDVAWSIQGGAAGQPSTFTDITWRRNLVYRNSQSEEYWYGGSSAVGFVNCVSEYNTNLFAGYGFGGDTRPDTNSRVHVLNYGWGTQTADLTLRRNIYYDGRVAFAYSAATPTGLDSQRNVVLLRPGTKMLYQDSQTVEQAAAWIALRGREQHSMVGVLPTSGDTSISDGDVTTAIASLDQLARTGQQFGGKVIPIHSPWRAA